MDKVSFYNKFFWKSVFGWWISVCHLYKLLQVSTMNVIWRQQVEDSLTAEKVRSLVLPPFSLHLIICLFYSLYTRKLMEYNIHV